MKNNTIRFALLLMVLAAVGCSDPQEDIEDEVQSFSSYVRDVFDESANEEAESVVEGEDFQFSAADQLETYRDLIATGKQ